MQTLKIADYLAARNKVLFAKLKGFVDHEKLSLCPDSASVVAKLWPKNFLENLMSYKAKAAISNFENGYIIFQAMLKTKQKIGTIKNQLNRLYDRTNLPIVFLPLGRARQHED